MSSHLSANARIVIVGGGVAGVRAAAALRGSGFEGTVTLLAAETHLPYDRPPLSKQVLRDGNLAAAQLHDTAWYAEQRIDLQRGARVTVLDTTQRSVRTADGTQHPWDALLIATGATPRRLALPGADATNVHILRTLDDAQALHAALTPGARVVLIGFGWIGAEVAAVAIARGCHVTALDALPRPFPLLGSDAGERIAAWHRANGVDLRTGTTVSAFETSTVDGATQVRQVHTSDGAVIDADVVLVSIGVTPTIEWLAGSGVSTARGMLVDATGRTSIDGVWAAGDVAEWPHPLTHTPFLLEHVEHAAEHAAHVARSMLGVESTYNPVPFFASEQGALTLQLVGFPEVADQHLLHPTDDDTSWSVALFRAGILCGVLACNRFSEVSAARRLLRSGRMLSVDDVLAAPDLRSLARGR